MIINSDINITELNLEYQFDRNISKLYVLGTNTRTISPLQKMQGKLRYILKINYAPLHVLKLYWLLTYAYNIRFEWSVISATHIHYIFN